MIVGPKYKICKRLGGSVFEKCQTQKFTLSEARAGRVKKGKGNRQASDYSKQMIEKQRMRYTYGLTEKQFRRYVDETVSDKTNTDPIGTLITKLETRLDNTVFRMGFAPTRRAARQMVSHGHITVNERKVTIPSIKVSVGDKIGVRKGSEASTLFAKVKEEGTPSAAQWLSADAKNLSGVITGMPDNKNTELAFDPQQVLEFYSR